MPPKIEDLRIQWTKVVLPPVFLEEDLPITETQRRPFLMRVAMSPPFSPDAIRVCWFSWARVPFTTRAPPRVRVAFEIRYQRIFRGSAHCDARLF